LASLYRDERDDPAQDHGRLKEQAARFGLDRIEAPVSGGAEKASRGTITILVCGD
jgi:3-hydroxyisobutyrate dehydrogenase-like beta-hydroxyacid dehydrogenase